MKCLVPIGIRERRGLVGLEAVVPRYKGLHTHDVLGQGRSFLSLFTSEAGNRRPTTQHISQNPLVQEKLSLNRRK